MTFVSGLIKVAKGAAVGIVAVTALPIFGAVGTITAAGIVVGAAVGAVAGVADEVIESKNKKKVTEENMKKCPACAELIQKEAKVCRFCGAKFEAA